MGTEFTQQTQRSRGERWVGTQIGPYRIVRCLGAGGMGTVLEGYNDQIGRRVALKLLHLSTEQNRMALARFATEARAANIVQHPSIVQITESGQTEDGCPYLVMEFLAGDTLHEAHRAEPGPWPQLRVLRLAIQLASALAAAHACNIIHRDLKPANIMLLSDSAVAGGTRVKLLDFGIAKLLDHCTAISSRDDIVTITDGRESLHTRTGALLGTPRYMSPEQCCDSSVVTDRSDVYSLGVVLYELLAGQPPFVDAREVMLLLRHVQETERPLRQRVAEISPDMAALVHRMLRKQSTDRPAMAEVQQELLRLLESQSAAPQVPAYSLQPDAPDERSRPASRRRKLLVLATLFGPIVFGVAGAGLWSSSRLRHSSLPAQIQIESTAEALSPAVLSTPTQTAMQHTQPQPESTSDSPSSASTKQSVASGLRKRFPAPRSAKNKPPFTALKQASTRSPPAPTESPLNEDGPPIPLLR